MHLDFRIFLYLDWKQGKNTEQEKHFLQCKSLTKKDVVAKRTKYVTPDGTVERNTKKYIYILKFHNKISACIKHNIL